MLDLPSFFHYINRYVLWNYSDITDYNKFPCEEVACGESPFKFNRDFVLESQMLDLLKKIEYQYKDKTVRCSLDDLLASTGTTSFIITKNDTILYEKYFNGYKRESINTSFSMAKTFTSALIGIAIDEGYIKSIDNSILDYIPELKGRISDDLAIKHLLTMSSGIRYSTSYYPWSDEPKSYYYPDLQQLVLRSVKQEYQPGLYFKYSNYNTILLGLILERVTKVPANKYLQEKIWKPIGMEFPATWSSDSTRTRQTKMESGINARSIDFAKFGKLFLDLGRWNGVQVMPEKWIIESSSPLIGEDKKYYIEKNYFPYSMFFKDKQLYYKYGWWGLKVGDTSFDYIAIGHLGQFIYVCPEKNIIIVRNGFKWGEINWWPKLFREIVELI